MIKKFLLFILANVFLLSYANADDKIGMTHEFGLSIPYYYHYSEPEFMYMEAEFEEDAFQSYGLIYNFKNAFLFNGFLNELELDINWQYFIHDYGANTSTPYDDLIFQVWNSRALYGLQISDRVMLKTGFGYRNHDDQTGGASNHKDCAGCYDREQIYHYIPFIAELDASIGNNDGKLKIEYDHIYYGKIDNGRTKTGTTPDVTMRNDDGYMVKVSYKIPYEGFYLEPYYEFITVEESDVVASGGSNWQEPSNTTKEYGIKLTKKFGADKLTSISDAKRITNISDNYYFGFGLMETEVESGFSALTGTAALDEKDWGQKLFAGINLNEYVDLEFAFNKFGDTILSCNEDDTFVADGRYKKGTSAAGTWTCGADNTSINIHSNSVSVAIKPKFDVAINNDLDVSIFGTIGVTQWDQSETTLVVASSTSVYDYSGHDPFYGIGVTAQQNALSFSFEYQEYEMYYDAKAIVASISYKF